MGDATLAHQAATHFAREGIVEFSRFVAALLPSRRGLLMRHLRHTFNRLDADGDGVLTKEDVRRLVETEGPPTEQRPRLATAMFQVLSNDGESPVSFEEFRGYFENLAAASPSATQR